MLFLKFLYEWFIILIALLVLRIFDFIVSDLKLQFVRICCMFFFQIADVCTQIIHLSCFESDLLLQYANNLLHVFAFHVIVSFLIVFGCLQDSILIGIKSIHKCIFLPRCTSVHVDGLSELRRSRPSFRCWRLWTRLIFWCHACLFWIYYFIDSLAEPLWLVQSQLFCFWLFVFFSIIDL